MALTPLRWTYLLDTAFQVSREKADTMCSKTTSAWCPCRQPFTEPPSFNIFDLLSCQAPTVILITFIIQKQLQKSLTLCTVSYVSQHHIKGPRQATFKLLHELHSATWVVSPHYTVDIVTCS